MTKTKLKNLTDWDWITLVAAWRYYEYRMTITSSTFPCDIIRRYFTGKYTEESCKRIARQFAHIDHHNGESDWTESQSMMDGDKNSWCKFYAFCKAWCDGFTTVVLDGEANSIHLHEEPLCFYCEYTQRWYPKDDYIAYPWAESYCSPKFIKEIKK